MIMLDSSKEEFEKLELSKPTNNFNSIVIIPTGEIHDSGYGCMKFALFNHRVYVGCVGGGSDVIHLNGIGGYGDRKFNEVLLSNLIERVDFSIDLLPNGLFRIFTSICTCHTDTIQTSDFCIYAEKEVKERK